MAVAMKDNDLVILVHGFARNEKDMFSLKRHLERWGYRVATVNLPTLFGSLEQCCALFEDQFNEIMRGVGASRRVHFVGHSMGGLIIRSFLAKRVINNLGRCVLIGTPNQGSKLADLARALFKPSIEIFKPLKCLLTDGVNISEPLNSPFPDIGVIAGVRNNLLLGVFLPKDSDGRVELESAKLDGMKDFVIKDFNHLEIHHKRETAELVHCFLQNGNLVIE